jgi:N6-adenosine-specific RNA methylase IME4
MMFESLKGRKYKIIYADPPWSYQNKFEKSRGAEAHYPTMDIEQIKQMPVTEITDDNSILFLWVTFPLLQEGLDVIKAWGFIYKTLGFGWVKTTKNGKLFIGMGHYTRSNLEVCLLGIKGKPVIISRDVSNVHVSKVEQHSQKPIQIKDKIVRVFGDIPRLELFSREITPGWDVIDMNLDVKHVQDKKPRLLKGFFDLSNIGIENG